MIKRLTIFASYSADPDVHPFLLYHLEQLRKFSDEVHYVSNSPISPTGQQNLRAHCAKVIERENTGFDFAAWRDAIGEIDPVEWDEILLVNSSIIGPLFDLSGVFDKMADCDCDFWGLTRNYEIKPHIQSFFILFRKPVFTSSAWREFWGAVQDEKNKRDVIKKYEVQFMNFFEKRGFRSATFITRLEKGFFSRYSIRRVHKSIFGFVPINYNKRNITILFPIDLINRGMPYLKASLLWGDEQRYNSPIEKIVNHPMVDYDWSLIGLERKL